MSRSSVIVRGPAAFAPELQGQCSSVMPSSKQSFSSTFSLCVVTQRGRGQSRRKRDSQIYLEQSMSYWTPCWVHGGTRSGLQYRWMVGVKCVSVCVCVFLFMKIRCILGIQYISLQVARKNICVACLCILCNFPRLLEHIYISMAIYWTLNTTVFYFYCFFLNI